MFFIFSLRYTYVFKLIIFIIKMNKYRRLVYVAENSPLLQIAKDEIKPHHLIVVGEHSTEGLMRGEDFNTQRLRESIERVEKDFSKKSNLGLPSFLQEGDLIQRNYLFEEGIISVPFVTFQNRKGDAEGFVIYGLNNHFLAVVQRAYGLPFPEKAR